MPMEQMLKTIQNKCILWWCNWGDKGKSPWVGCFNNTQSFFTVIVSFHHNAINNREVRMYLTNKEASTVLCLVVKHTGSVRPLASVEGNTRHTSGPTSRVLYRFQSRLLSICLFDIESINFPTHWAIIFSNQLFFFQKSKSGVSMHLFSDKAR